MPLTLGDLGGCGCGITFCGCTGLPTSGTMTTPNFGTFTMTWTGTKYTGSITYNYPGGTVCPAKVITLTADITCVTPGTSWGIAFSSLTELCPVGGGGFICPGVTHALASTGVITAGFTLTCSPFSAVWNIVATAPQGCTLVGTYSSNLFLNVSGPITFTP